ncbi:hypothetical protein BC827DRAFT_1159338 [Russula dissimulans]|nr:hypothetical protein BC827DRAFT_1159338 [Russula dissimulans]
MCLELRMCLLSKDIRANRVVHPTSTDLATQPDSTNMAMSDNVAQPVLKQQRVALQQHREANNTSTSDNVSSDDGPPRGQVTHQPNPKPHLEVVDSTDDGSNSSDNDSNILKEFVPKSTGQKRGEVAREAATEMPEQECAWLMKTWDAPVYAFYDPIPAIEELHGQGSRRGKRANVNLILGS